MRWSLALVLGASVVVLLVCLVFDAPVRGKVVVSVGLVFDIAGVLLVGLTLLWPYRDPTGEGRQFVSHHEPFRSQAVVAHQERLTLPMQVGLCVIVIGFLLQLLSVWL